MTNKIKWAPRPINWKYCSQELPADSSTVWLLHDTNGFKISKVFYSDEIFSFAEVGIHTKCFAWCELDEIPLPVKNEEHRCFDSHQGDTCKEIGKGVFGFASDERLIDSRMCYVVNFCPICGEESPAHKKEREL